MSSTLIEPPYGFAKMHNRVAKYLDRVQPYLNNKHMKALDDTFDKATNQTKEAMDAIEDNSKGWFKTITLRIKAYYANVAAYLKARTTFLNEANPQKVLKDIQDAVSTTSSKASKRKLIVNDIGAQINKGNGQAAMQIKRIMHGTFKESILDFLPKLIRRLL